MAEWPLAAIAIAVGSADEISAKVSLLSLIHLMHQISSNLEIKTSGESCSKPVNPTIQLRDGYCSPFLVEFEMVMCFSLMLGLLGPCVIFTALALLILTGGASGLIES